MAKGLGFFHFLRDIAYWKQLAELRILQKKLPSEVQESIVTHLRSLPRNKFDKDVDTLLQAKEGTQIFLQAKEGTQTLEFLLPRAWKQSDLFKTLSSYRRDTATHVLEPFIDKVESLLSSQYVENSDLKSLGNQKECNKFNRQKFNNLRSMLNTLGDRQEEQVVADWLRYQLVRLFRDISENSYLNIHVFREDFEKLDEAYDQVKKTISDDFIYQLTYPFLQQLAQDQKEDITSDFIFNAPLDEIIRRNIVVPLKKSCCPYKKDILDDKSSYFEDPLQGFQESDDDYMRRVSASDQEYVHKIKLALDQRILHLGVSDQLDPLETFDAFYRRKHPEIEHFEKDKEEKVMPQQSLSSKQVLAEPLHTAAERPRQQESESSFLGYLFDGFASFFSKIGGVIANFFKLSWQYCCGSNGSDHEQDEPKIIMNEVPYAAVTSPGLRRLYEQQGDVGMEHKMDERSPDEASLSPSSTSDAEPSLGFDLHRTESEPPDTPRI